MNQLIDVQGLLNRCDQRQHLAKRLLQSFVESIEDYQQELITVYQQRDLVGLARLVHRLRGAAAMVSADHLAKLAASVERSLALNPDNQSDLRESVDDLLLHLLDWILTGQELDWPDSQEIQRQ